MDFDILQTVRLDVIICLWENCCFLDAVLLIATVLQEKYIVLIDHNCQERTQRQPKILEHAIPSLYRVCISL